MHYVCIFLTEILEEEFVIYCNGVYRKPCLVLPEQKGDLSACMHLNQRRDVCRFWCKESRELQVPETGELLLSTIWLPGVSTVQIM